MIERYSDSAIGSVWTDGNKLIHWQKVELAVIKAMEDLGVYPAGVYEKIKTVLEANPVDDPKNIAWWKKKDKELTHDLNAFLDERLRFIPPELHQYWHKGLTSYDTEEPASSLLLLTSVEVVEKKGQEMLEILSSMALNYRYMPMMGRTHGQEAKLQSFGKRCHTWHKNLKLALDQLTKDKELIYSSKLSGAIGNYQGLTPDQEFAALELLGLKPFKGATQIMPRLIHLPLANSLVMVVGALTQIAEDVALGARSGNPIYQEPFGKKQKGSSAMPHKKNTITCEQQKGLLGVAMGYYLMIQSRITTWEERAIEQSCVERIAWPDLFHVVMRSFKNMKKVCSGLQVYPDNMMKEIIRSRGCYASEDAKDWLKKIGSEFELTHEAVYRLVQLACFNAHQISKIRSDLRSMPVASLEQAEKDIITMREEMQKEALGNSRGLYVIISQAELVHTSELEIMAGEINGWNEVLRKIFSEGENLKSFKEIFSLEYQLRGEPALFKELK
jgi:adenylosuccinate lyase